MIEWIFGVLAALFLMSSQTPDEPFRTARDGGMFATECGSPSAYLEHTDCFARAPHEHFTVSTNGGTPYEGEFDIDVLEVDQNGRFWAPRYAEKVLATVADEAQTNSGVLLVTFIHGWQHNGAHDDPNLLNFRRVLEQLAFEEVSKNGVGRIDFCTPPAPGEPVKTERLRPKIHGIFIAWRGREVKGPISFLTFWSRKKAAERIGGGRGGEKVPAPGTFRRFLSDLDTIYRKSLRNDPRKMTMVTVGHSFGGQLLFAAEKSVLEQRSLAGSPRAMPAERGTRDNPPFVQGYGDLSILLNPAMEARQYKKLAMRSEEGNFNTAQWPVLVTIASKHDRIVHFLFPIGEALSLKSYRPGVDKRLVALGHYPGFMTHDLVVNGSAPGSKNPADSFHDMEQYRNAVAILTRKAHPERDGIVQPSDFALAARQRFHDGTLAPRKEDLDPHDPFLVISAEPFFSDGHGDIWKASLVRFISGLISEVRAKKQLVICRQGQLLRADLQ